MHMPYAEWYKQHHVTEETLRKQRKTTFDKNPLISIIVPTYKTPIDYLKEMIESVRAQTYPNWELCIGDGSEGDKELEAVLEEYAREDKRIHYKILEKNMLNKNLDLNLSQYISVDFGALATAINCMDGLDVTMTSQEIFWMNGYIDETVSSSGIFSETVDDAGDGVYHLDGIQATAFCRIRYTEGDDYKRTERQRYILGLILDKAKTMDMATLNNIMDQVFPMIQTNLSLSEMVSLATQVLKLDMGESMSVSEVQSFFGGTQQQQSESVGSGIIIGENDTELLIVTNNHDLPNVTLVGALAADLSLHADDFRAAERAFQLLTQACGRAGRGERGGNAVIQTYDPDHYAITYAAKQDYEGFFNKEILYRELMDYPPAASMGICLLAQARVKTTYSKYSRVRSVSGLTGARAADQILYNAGIRGVRIEHIEGQLTDNYDPRTRVLHLSDSTFNSTSVAAIGVAAHGTGRGHYAEGLYREAGTAFRERSDQYFNSGFQRH